MQKKIVVFGLLILGISLAGLGCATTGPATYSYPAMGPIPPPTPGYGIKVQNLLVLTDISRSMREADKIGVEKAFLKSFNDAIPNGLKNGGLRTFGKSAYYSTVLVQPVKKYDRPKFSEIIDELKAGCGNTPIALALDKARIDLEDAEGNIAILLVSDGENPVRDPLVPAIALKQMFGDRICIHTVHVGDSDRGREMMELIARHSGCGIAASASDLQSEAAMKKFVTTIFYEEQYVDSDGDGVPDWADKCPNTPKGVKVDKNGCPLDSDGDGVPDYLDKCPDTLKGVKVDRNGCPLDSDGDGVPDYLDKCPDTPKGVKVDRNGCPPDSDGDGVPDYKDQCPNTPKGAPVNSVGCWTLKGINFDYNKWDIKPEYYGLLDENIQVLKMNPTMKVEIRGYTDSTGSDQYNQALSQKRAESVKDYFISKGISPDRITSRGLGESNPIATNETPEGRAENRRIEIKVISR